jgi:LacI family transcriptional regulator
MTMQAVVATLDDVAKRAGTSVATAGRALGGYGKVAAATRERVLKAARQLRYRPNALARSMKQRSSLTIGVIVGNVCNPFLASSCARSKIPSAATVTR